MDCRPRISVRLLHWNHAKCLYWCRKSLFWRVFITNLKKKCPNLKKNVVVLTRCVVGSDFLGEKSHWWEKVVPLNVGCQSGLPMFCHPSHPSQCCSDSWKVGKWLDQKVEVNWTQKSNIDWGERSDRRTYLRMKYYVVLHGLEVPQSVWY